MEAKNIAIIGKGYIGSLVAASFPNSFTYTGSRIESVEDANRLFSERKIDVLINCAGTTGKPNVDWCETHQEETYNGNVLLPTNLAIAAKKNNCLLVHLGSGCIYESGLENRVFTEEDTPNFEGSFYSKTKALGEKALSKFDNTLQLRLRMPFDGVPSERNLITKLLGYAKKGNPIVNVPNSLTYLPDLISAMKFLISNDQRGIFNVVNHGSVTHQQIFELYNYIAGTDFKPNFISSDDLDKQTVARRSNCILSDLKLENAGFKIRKVTEALEDAIRKYSKA